MLTGHGIGSVKIRTSRGAPLIRADPYLVGDLGNAPRALEYQTSDLLLIESPLC